MLWSWQSRPSDPRASSVTRLTWSRTLEDCGVHHTSANKAGPRWQTIEHRTIGKGIVTYNNNLAIGNSRVQLSDEFHRQLCLFVVLDTHLPARLIRAVQPYEDRQRKALVPRLHCDDEGKNYPHVAKVEKDFGRGGQQRVAMHSGRRDLLARVPRERIIDGNHKRSVGINQLQNQTQNLNTDIIRYPTGTTEKPMKARVMLSTYAPGRLNHPSRHMSANAENPPCHQVLERNERRGSEASSKRHQHLHE